MSPARSPRRAAVLLAALAGCFCLSAARAADKEAPDDSRKFVPADSAFYSTMLRNKEQVDLVAESKAWAKLWSLPSVQQGWKAVEDQYKNPSGNLASLRQLMQADENKDLVAMLGDSVSDEVFCYGDDSWNGFLGLYQEAYAAMQYGPLIDQLENKNGDRSANERQARAVLSVLAKHPDQIKIPALVIGFKVSDAARAEKQIKRLDALVKALGAQFPDVKEKVARTKVGGASFLTLTVKGSDLPWDNVSLKSIEDKPGEFTPVLDKLKAATLTVSLGVAHGYLLLAVGSSAEVLSRFGGDGAHLDGLPEFKPLAKFADKKLTSIGYVSKTFLQAAGNYSRQIDALTALAKAGLAKADLKDEDRDGLLKDLQSLGKSVREAEADQGSMMSFSFLTDRGFEGFGYYYGKQPGIDGSKPLTLLDHLGGAPLMALVGRGANSVADYEKMVAAIEEAYPRLDRIARDKLTGADKERFQKAKDDFLPLIKRLSETTAKELLPALADGQAGFVIDARWKSKQWQKAMPATKEAMPMPELALIMGVSDAEALVKAMSDYRDVLNEAIAKAKTWPGGDKIGDFQVPEPKTDKSKSGTLYSWALPAEAGLDAKVLPTAALSKEVAVLTLSHGMAERLMESHPLKNETGPLAAKDRPLAAASVFDWAELVTAATPWVEYGAAKALESQGADKEGRAAVLDQVKTVLDVLKCFRGATSATYVEDGVLVTHSESVYRDLEK